MHRSSHAVDVPDALRLRREIRSALVLHRGGPGSGPPGGPSAPDPAHEEFVYWEEWRAEHPGWEDQKQDPEMSTTLNDVPLDGKDIDREAWVQAGGSADEIQLRQDFVSFADGWSGSGNMAENIRQTIDGGGMFGGEYVDKAVGTLTRALDAAPRIESELYRGMAETPGRDLAAFAKTAVGDHLDLGASSFSTDLKLGSGYAPRTHTSVLLKVEEGARGVPLGSVGTFADEREVISAGRFVVTGVEQEGSRTVIRVRQL